MRLAVGGSLPHREFRDEARLAFGGASLLLLLIALQSLSFTPPPSASSAGGPAAESEAVAASGGRVMRDFGRLPLSFEPNTGIAAGRYDFLNRGPDYSLALSATRATLALDRGHPAASVLEMRLLGADPAASGAGVERLEGTVNYLSGPDRGRWRTGVPTYAGVSYANVYDGIGVRYHGSQGRLEYDFELAPRADPAQIALGFDGARSLSVARSGDLVLRVPGGTVRERGPVAYQRVDGERRAVAVRYVLDGDRARFGLGPYDRSRPLTIDPLVVAYSTFLGGADNEDYGTAVAVDSTGSAYVAGTTYSGDFPTTPGADDTTLGGMSDAYVAKLAPNGQSLVYSTFLGGMSSDGANGIAVDASGAALVTGSTFSNNFPTTRGADDTVFSGDEDAFVTKLLPSGQDLAFSTFLGGSGSEAGFGIAIDSAASAYVTGTTGSNDFPTTPGAFDTAYSANNDAFVAKVQPNGQDLAYSTYLGHTSNERGYGIAVDAAGNAYVTGWTHSSGFPTGGGAFDTSFGGGQDGFVTKVSASGAGLAYSAFLGGNNDTAGLIYDEEGYGIAVDAAGAAYVTGNTPANDFPTTAGSFDTAFAGPSDAFVTKVAPGGGALSYSTYLGGSGEEYGRGIAVDAQGVAHVAGTTYSADFPTADGFDTSLGGSHDMFKSAFAANGQTLPNSTILGGGAFEISGGIALDPAGNAYVTGISGSGDFPISPAAFDGGLTGGGEATMTKIGFSDVTPPGLGAKAKRKQGTKRVKLTVSCDEPCTVTASGRVTTKGGGQKEKRFAAAVKGGKLGPKTTQLAANQSTVLKLKLKAKARRAVERKLRSGAKATAKLTVEATDGAGNVSTDKLKVKLR